METLMHGALGRLHASVMPFRKWKIELSDYGTTLVIPKSFPPLPYAAACAARSCEGFKRRVPSVQRAGRRSDNQQEKHHDRYSDRLSHTRRRGVGHRQGQVCSARALCKRRLHACVRSLLRYGHVHAQEGAADGQRLSEHHRVHPLHVLEPSCRPRLPDHDDGGLCLLHDAHRRQRRLRDHRDQAAFHHQESVHPDLRRLHARQGRLDGDHLGRGPRRALSGAHGSRACRARHQQEGDWRRVRHVGRLLARAARRLDGRLRQGLRPVDSRLRLPLQDSGRYSDCARHRPRARLLAALA